MGRTPDRFPGARIEERISLEDQAANPPEIGDIQRNGSDILAKDGTGVFNLRSGTGLTAGSHRALDQLVHELAENRYTEVVRSAGQVTDVIEWTDSGKTQKIRETNIARSGGQVSQIVIKQYDGAGALITGETATGVVARSGGQVTSIDWTMS